MPIYNQHSPSTDQRSDVERGYPYVNYIVHERTSGLIACEYDYVDLGLVVFLHGYLDRDTKERLQARAEQLMRLMRSSEPVEGGTEARLKEFREAATEVASISNNIPEIEMMGRRLTQKYSSPNPKLQTIFQMADSDNREFLENSVRAVAQGTKVLQDLFLVDFEKRHQEFEKRHEEYRDRIENFLKVISAFAVVVVLKEIWPRENAKDAITTLKSFMTARGLHWPTMFVDHSGYFHSSFLVGAGLFSTLVLYVVLDDNWKPGWSKTFCIGPILLSAFVWVMWGLPTQGFLFGVALAGIISMSIGKGPPGRFTWRSIWLFLALASLPFYALMIYKIGYTIR